MLSTRRLTLLMAGITMMVLAVLLRTLDLQVFGADYADTSLAQQLEIRELTAPRGNIYDRNGNLLAVSNRSYNIRVDLRAITDTTQVAEIVASVVQKPMPEVRVSIETIIQNSKSQTGTRSTLLYPNISIDMAHTLTQTIVTRKIAGLQVEPTWARSYPQGSLAGPVVGFVSLQPVGYSGVEGYYNQSLNPELGKISGAGKLNLTGITMTQMGADVLLTLDMQLQRFVEQTVIAATQKYQAVQGTIIVMDTRTGAILASASAPGYDPNQAMDMANDDNAAKLLTDPAVSNLYEPGSVLKLLTTAAALQAGTTTTSTIYQDDGKLEVGGRKIYNSDRASHGKVDLEEMLEKSLNVVAAQIAIEMGPEKFYNAIRAFGVGGRTGVDLGNEPQGVLRTPASIEWSKSDLATNSYGQGLSMTPLQVLAAINAIANDGVLIQPYIVQEWRGPNGEVVVRQPVQIQRTVSPEVAKIVRTLMMAATRKGTPKAMLTGYSIAGKTGTADWYERGIKQETSKVTYVGMLPALQPKITILVKFDQPKNSRWASDNALPVFHDVAEMSAKILGIPPDLVDVGKVASSK